MGERTYQESSNWVNECKNCTCVQSVPVCTQVQCRYEPCELGKQLVLNERECCPKCELPKQACFYQDYLIQHNTEFSPTLCETCKCKDGRLECFNSCAEEEAEERLIGASISLDQRFARLRHHHRGHRLRDKPFPSLDTQSADINSFEAKSACLHDNRLRPFNSIWSSAKCVKCKCGFNSIIECFVRDCPSLKNCEYVSIFTFNFPIKLRT